MSKRTRSRIDLSDIPELSSKQLKAVNARRKKGIAYGNVELDPDTFAPQNVKERITMMVNQDVLSALRAIAKKKGVKSQTLLNQMIRGFLGLDSRTKRTKIDDEHQEWKDSRRFAHT